MTRPNARARADLAPLTVATIRKVVLSMYHRRHDYWTDADIAELLPELSAFNITTAHQHGTRIRLRDHAAVP